VLLEFGSQCVLSVAFLNEAVFQPSKNCPLDDGSAAACAAAHFYAAHLSLACKWVISQARKHACAAAQRSARKRHCMR
jgi:hypothetical protein